VHAQAAAESRKCSMAIHPTATQAHGQQSENGKKKEKDSTEIQGPANSPNQSRQSMNSHESNGFPWNERLAAVTKSIIAPHRALPSHPENHRQRQRPTERTSPLHQFPRATSALMNCFIGSFFHRVQLSPVPLRGLSRLCRKSAEDAGLLVGWAHQLDCA